MSDTALFGVERRIFGRPPVISRLAAPPGSPVYGDRYLVIATGSGAWTGKENQIAEWRGSAWLFETPTPGFLLYDTGTGDLLLFGNVWAAVGGGSGITQLTGDVTAGPGSGSQVATIANDAVTGAKLRNSAATSVMGKAGAGAGDPADIAASGDGQVLRQAAGSLGFGDIPEASVTGLTAALAARLNHPQVMARGVFGGPF